MEVIALDSRSTEAHTIPNFPPFIELQTDGRCNADCTVCPYPDAARRFKPTAMPIEMINILADECSENRSEICRVLPYLNNEPSLDTRLIDILRRFKAAGHFIELSSNMSGMTEPKLKIIIEEGLIDDFKVSFFGGDPQTYDKLMPKLDFSRSVKAVRTLWNLKLNANSSMHTEIVYVLAPWTDVNREVQLIRELFPEIPIHGYGFLDRAGSVKAFKNSLRHSKDTSDRVRLVGCSLRRPAERICILANGEVVLCSQDWYREVRLGNVFDEGIKGVWKSDKFAEARAQVLSKSDTDYNFICKRCKLAVIEEELSNGQLRQVQNFNGDRHMTSKDKKQVEVDY